MGVIEKLNYPHIGLFILSWFLVDRFIPIIIHICKRLNLLDTPGGYKKHREAVPYLGGIGIFLAISIAIVSVLRFEYFIQLKPLIWIIICTFIVLIIGIIDDIKKINAILKLTILLALTIFLYFNGVRLSIFNENFAIFNIIVSTLWLAGVTSAFNSIDNSDGICSGVTAIISFFLFLINWVYYNITDSYEWRNIHKILSYASISLCGATIGFLRYNFSPARIFLGDNGSLTIGFFLGAVSILGIWSNIPHRALFLPICLLSVPLFDITFSTILRVKNGWIKTIPQAIKWCGNDHLAHRLKNLNLPDNIISYIIYLFTIFCCTIAFIISNPYISDIVFYTIVVLFFFILLLITFMLDKIKVDISNSYK